MQEKKASVFVRGRQLTLIEAVQLRRIKAELMCTKAPMRQKKRTAHIEFVGKDSCVPGHNKAPLLTVDSGCMYVEDTL